MDANKPDDLLYLIRCAVNRRKADSARIRTMDLDALYHMSRFHSLAALTYTALESAGEQDILPKGWKEARDTALRNAVLFSAERNALEKYCEETGIWYLPLKGILLQKEYPGLGLREMVDNDILFDAAFRQQIHDWFAARGYTVKQYWQAVDDIYHKPPIFNFEMHTELFDASRFPEWAAYFEGALERLQPIPGSHWGRQFTAEDFYLYMLAHMYKHFATGGTGLRSLLDLYLFRRAHGKELNREVLRKGLEQLNLSDYERETSALAERAFGSEEPLCAADAEKLAYYLASGTHGTGSLKLHNELQKIAGKGQAITGTTKVRYGLQRLFPGRAFMEIWCRHDAPFFLHHRRLMPLAYGYRLVYNLLHGKGKKLVQEQRSLWKRRNN